MTLDSDLLPHARALVARLSVVGIYHPDYGRAWHRQEARREYRERYLPAALAPHWPRILALADALERGEPLPPPPVLASMKAARVAPKKRRGGMARAVRQIRRACR